MHEDRIRIEHKNSLKVLIRAIMTINLGIKPNNGGRPANESSITLVEALNLRERWTSGVFTRVIAWSFKKFIMINKVDSMYTATYSTVAPVLTVIAARIHPI